MIILVTTWMVFNDRSLGVRLGAACERNRVTKTERGETRMLLYNDFIVNIYIQLD
jgi:hypothetical protein